MQSSDWEDICWPLSSFVKADWTGKTRRGHAEVLGRNNLSKVQLIRGNCRWQSKRRLGEIGIALLYGKNSIRSVGNYLLVKWETDTHEFGSFIHCVYANGIWIYIKSPGGWWTAMLLTLGFMSQLCSLYLSNLIFHFFLIIVVKISLIHRCLDMEFYVTQIRSPIWTNQLVQRHVIQKAHDMKS